MNQKTELQEKLSEINLEAKRFHKKLSEAKTLLEHFYPGTTGASSDGSIDERYHQHAFTVYRSLENALANLRLLCESE